MALSIDKTPREQALVVIPATIYLLFSIYNFIKPGSLKIFRSYGDLLFVPTLIFLADKREALWSILPFVALKGSRRTFESMLFLWLSLGLSFYYYGKEGIILLPLLMAHFFASLHPDLVEALQKERFYIKKLRNAYRKLSKDYGKMERDTLELKIDKLLLEKLKESPTLEGYLYEIKELFGLKGIKLLPLKDYYERASIDKSTCSYQIPIKLERGYAQVIFYLNNPLELYDERLLRNLEKAGKLINLYIEGFEEKAKEIAL
ncbi:MAG: hypothetical protein ACK4MW_01930 [Aquificaceae bacterium]